MPKPKSIAWLEEQTGQRIDYTPEPERPERHLSVRLGGDLGVQVSATHQAQNAGIFEQIIQQAGVRLKTGKSNYQP